MSRPVRQPTDEPLSPSERGPSSHTSGYTVCQSRSTKLCSQPLRHRGLLVPWFTPIASVINSQWASLRPPSAVASAAAVPEGGWWTQEQLAEKGLAADPFCRACLTDTSSTGDSLWHRTCACPGRDPAVSDMCPPNLRKLALSNPSDPLFADGVPVQPCFPPAPVQEERWIGKLPRDGALARGQASTDGALRGIIPRTNRAGWAYSVDDGSEGLWGRYTECVLKTTLRFCGPNFVHSLSSSGLRPAPLPFTSTTRLSSTASSTVAYGAAKRGAKARICESRFGTGWEKRHGRWR